MKFPVLLISLVLSVAQADEFVVKVQSSAQRDMSSLQVGSGVLLKDATSVYVLSSEHVFYHGGRGAGLNHSFALAGRKIELEYLAADVFTGLALLKVVEPTESLRNVAWPVDQIPAEHDEFVEIRGFPFFSNSLDHDKHAQILALNGTRPVIPMVDELIEVRGHSEYGMSGGALVNPNSEFLGILSHQFLRLHLGAPSTIEYYSPDDSSTGEREIVALVIPAKVALTWVQRVLRRDVSQMLALDPAMQLAQVDSGVIEGLRFTARACADGESPIGGRERGGEGAGISGNAQKPKPVCRIIVTWDKGPSGPRYPFKNVRWFTALRDRLSAGSEAEITGVYLNGERLDCSDLRGFFTRIRSGFTPITSIKDPFVRQPEVESNIKNLAAEVQKDVDSLMEQIPASLPLAKVHLVRVKTVSSQLINKHFELTSPEELKLLADSDVWTSILRVDFRKNVSIRSNLLRISVELSNLQL